MTTRVDIEFLSQGVRCAAWHYRAAPETARFGSSGGRPCVVMAHGFGATRDSGLAAFAEKFADAGLDCIVFDYRGFGASDGHPRQVVDIPNQLADYRAAVACARSLDGVDPDRIVLWGVSFAGGHVVALAAQDKRIAATIALAPAVDGLASLSNLLRHGKPSALARLTALGVRDAVAGVRKREPVLARITAEPGAVAVMTSPGAAESYASIAGPSWRNEVAGRVVLQVARYRPGREAMHVECPILVQVADLDRTAPPGAAMAAARRAPRAEVRHYPGDHFDAYADGPLHERVVAHQLSFLERHLVEAVDRHAPSVKEAKAAAGPRPTSIAKA